MEWLTPMTAIYAGLVAVPVLLVLYFLKLKRREHVVSCTLLWKRAVQDLQVNAPFQRLRRNILLLLQMLAIIAMLLALAGPLISRISGGGGRYVLLIDRSASMSATDVQPTRLDEAKKQARAFVESVQDKSLFRFGGDPNQIMVIAFDERSKLMCNFTADKRQILSAIDAISPGDGDSALSEAIVVAQAFATPEQLANNRSSSDLARLILFSDGRIDDLDQIIVGPIFGQVILADEINRATPKTQSAMLEAMQEHSVTSGGQVRKLPEPFVVLATQNPIEQEGTYPLPEAQLDRFFFKLLVPYSNRNELKSIVDRTTTGHTPQAKAVIDAARIIEAQNLVKHVAIAEHVQDYAIRLVLATHPQGDFAADITNRFVRFGSSPRGVQSLVLSAKVRAMLDERYHVSFSDIKASVLPALRHRILLNFEGQAEGVTTDDVLAQILEKVSTAAEAEVDVP